MAEQSDIFDERLRAAMHRRPEPAAPADLAVRAMRLAAAHRATIEPSRLRRFRLMARIASLAAVLLIGAFIVLGVRRLSDHGNLSLTPGNSWTDSSAALDTSASATAATNASSTPSSDWSSWTWFAMCGLIGLTGLGAVAALRQSPISGFAGVARLA